MSYKLSHKSVPQGFLTRMRPTRVSRKSFPPECPTRVSRNVVQECSARMSYVSVPRECQTRVSRKSGRQECPTRGSYTLVVPRECPTGVAQKCPTRVSYKCPTRVSHKSVLQEFFHKSVPQECPTRVATCSTNVVREAAPGSCGPQNWPLGSTHVVQKAASGSCGVRTGNL